MESYQDTIIAFLKGTLSESALQQFKKEIDNNPELAEEVQFQQKLLFVLDNKEQIDAHDMMKEIVDTNPIDAEELSNRPDVDYDTGNGGSSSFSRLPYLGLLFAGLLVFGAYKYLNPPKTYYQQIAAEYNLPMENLMNVGSISDADLVAGMNNYDKSEYQKSIPFLETYCAKNNDEVASFYLAISYLQIEKFDKAIEILLQLNKTENLILKNKIKHYLAIGYLSLNNYTDARKTLLTITPSERNQEISDLIKKIDKK